MDLHQLNKYIKDLKLDPSSLVCDEDSDDFQFKQVAKDQGTWVDASGKTVRVCRMIACMDRSLLRWTVKEGWEEVRVCVLFRSMISGRAE